jgi:hypothetical protein
VRAPLVSTRLMQDQTSVIHDIQAVICDEEQIELSA